MRTRLSFLVLSFALGACASFVPVSEEGMLATQQEVWWMRVKALCGKSFAGQLVEGNASDSAFARGPLVMRVQECGAEQMRIRLDVGADHSRNWIVSRTPAGFDLLHRHLHEDGTEGSPSGYGGETRTPGSATRQEFYADTTTARMLPAAARNVWTMEVAPGRAFAYALRREGTDRRFRVEFDLNRPTR
jgi:hypothetical protein